MATICLYEYLIDPVLRNIRRFVTGFSGMNAGDSVLDVCCGTGAQAIDFGRCGCRAYGIDLSPLMVTTAEKNRVRAGLQNVAFQVADAASLPYPDGSFDCATVTLALHDKETDIRCRIVGEMMRVVRAGGVIVIVDYQVPLPANAWSLVIKSIEGIAGGSHRRNFKDYYARGGIDDVLKHCALVEEQRVVHKGGQFVAVRAVLPGYTG